VTHLRQLMLDELQRRNYSQSTTRCYLHAVEDFARYFHRSPYRLGPDHIRQYQVHLFRDCKLSPGTIGLRTCALRFLFVKTLGRPYLPDHIPFPKRQLRLPTILDQQEVARLIDSASNLMHRTMMMLLYATGLRRAEMCHLKVSDIDSKRMVIHVRQGKGGRDRDVLLTPKLLGGTLANFSSFSLLKRSVAIATRRGQRVHRSVRYLVLLRNLEYPRAGGGTGGDESVRATGGPSTPVTS